MILSLKRYLKLNGAALVCVLSIFIGSAYAESTLPIAIDEHFCGSDDPESAHDISTLVTRLYQIVSGKAGEERDWAALKMLHKPDAIITPVFHQGDVAIANRYDLEGFINLNKQYFKDVDFYETEVAQKVFQYGHMATVLSHYQSRRALDKTPYSEGINSFQLLNDGRRWCVISATWDSDKGNHEKPEFKLERLRSLASEIEMLLKGIQSVIENRVFN